MLIVLVFGLLGFLLHSILLVPLQANDDLLLVTKYLPTCAIVTEDITDSSSDNPPLCTILPLVPP